jgi:hypothetical protein
LGASGGFKKRCNKTHEKTTLNVAKKGSKIDPQGGQNPYKNKDRKNTDAQCCKDAPKEAKIKYNRFIKQ